MMMIIIVIIVFILKSSPDPNFSRFGNTETLEKHMATTHGLWPPKVLSDFRQASVGTNDIVDGRNPAKQLIW